MSSPIGGQSQGDIFKERFAIASAENSLLADASGSGNPENLQADLNALIQALASLPPGTNLDQLLQGGENFALPDQVLGGSFTVGSLYEALQPLQGDVAAWKSNPCPATADQLAKDLFELDPSNAGNASMLLQALQSQPSIVPSDFMDKYQIVAELRAALSGKSMPAGGIAAHQFFLDYYQNNQEAAQIFSLPDLGISVMPPLSDPGNTAWTAGSIYQEYLDLNRSKNMTPEQKLKEFVTFYRNRDPLGTTLPFLQMAGLFTTTPNWPGAAILKAIQSAKS